MLEELVFEVLGIYATAASATVELARNPFHISEWAVNGDDVRGRTIISKCQVVGVGEVRGA